MVQARVMAPSARPRVVLVGGCGIKPPPPSATLPSSGVGPPPPSGSHPFSPAAPLLAGAVPLPLLPSRRLLALSAPSPAGRRTSPTLAVVYFRSSTGSLLLYSMLSASLPSLPWRGSSLRAGGGCALGQESLGLVGPLTILVSDPS